MQGHGLIQPAISKKLVKTLLAKLHGLLEFRWEVSIYLQCALLYQTVNVSKQRPKPLVPALAARQKCWPAVVPRRYGIGHIGGDATVTIGGRTRPNGTDLGKISSHLTGKKSPRAMHRASYISQTLKLDEVIKRTTFYDQVIWIIDATRRPTDRTQFAQMLEYNYSERFDGVDIYTVHHKETRLLKEWGSLGRIVGFDYGGDNLCLLTAAQGHNRYLFDFPKAEFSKSIIEGKPLPVVQFGKPTQRRYRRRRAY
jgi:hypothetical protein